MRQHETAFGGRVRVDGIGERGHASPRAREHGTPGGLRARRNVATCDEQTRFPTFRLVLSWSCLSSGGDCDELEVARCCGHYNATTRSAAVVVLLYPHSPWAGIGERNRNSRQACSGLSLGRIQQAHLRAMRHAARRPGHLRSCGLAYEQRCALFYFARPPR